MSTSQCKVGNGLLFLCGFFLLFVLPDLEFALNLHFLAFGMVSFVCGCSLWSPSSHTVQKLVTGVVFLGILLLQGAFVVFRGESPLMSGVSFLLLLLPFVVRDVMAKIRVRSCVCPQIDDGMLSFEDLRYINLRLNYKKEVLTRVGGVLTPTSVRDILCELPRNCSIRYVNKESLSDEYLKNLEDTMDDPFVYLVLSDTGSVASNFIGIMTNKPYNHISISFDPALKTLISYNGGEKLAPPGLNQELLEWFYKKEDASIRIYRLPVTLEQKKGMAEKIRQIDQEGSAYNLVGATIGRSIQPNIMVCSEFLYQLLKSVGAEYFEKTPLETTPTDMIELDYERKLQYVETLQLSTCCEEMMVKGKPVPLESKVQILDLISEQLQLHDQKIS